MTLREVALAQEGLYAQLREERKSDRKVIAEGCSAEMAQAMLNRIAYTTARMDKIEYALDILNMINE